MDNKRDFVYARGNTIYVSDKCKNPNCDNNTSIDRDDLSWCTKCNEVHFLSIRDAKKSYPTANIEII